MLFAASYHYESELSFGQIREMHQRLEPVFAFSGEHDANVVLRGAVSTSLLRERLAPRHFPATPRPSKNIISTNIIDNRKVVDT